MTTASLQEIKKELRNQDETSLQELCMRLAKYKKENKELLNYLLFEAHHEHAYIENVKEEIRELFKTVPSSNVYFIKKSLRKILRLVNRQIKYSGIKQTELEVRIFFCTKMKEAKIPRTPGTVLFNLYQQQLKKIESAFAKLPEDIRADYDRELKNILN
jgi:membrane-anchored protein YejM (alkaline phosphatase superfamily)